MKERSYLEELISRYPVLEPVQNDIWNAYEQLKTCFENGGNCWWQETAGAVLMQNIS